MIELAWFIGMVFWMGAGGWAFGVLGRQEPLSTEQTGALAIICMILGPFMAGWAIADLIRGRRE